MACTEGHPLAGRSDVSLTTAGVLMQCAHMVKAIANGNHIGSKAKVGRHRSST